MRDAALRQIDDDHGKIVQPDSQLPVQIACLIKVPVFRGLAPGGNAAARIGHQQRYGVSGLQKRQRHFRSVRETGQLLLEAVVAEGCGSRPRCLKRLVGHVQRLLETSHRFGDDPPDVVTGQTPKMPSHFVRRAVNEDDRNLYVSVTEQGAIPRATDDCLGSNSLSGRISSRGFVRGRCSADQDDGRCKRHRVSDVTEFHRANRRRIGVKLANCQDSTGAGNPPNCAYVASNPWTWKLTFATQTCNKSREGSSMNSLTRFRKPTASRPSTIRWS